jgi:hypothetical protein
LLGWRERLGRAFNLGFRVLRLCGRRLCLLALCGRRLRLLALCWSLTLLLQL